MAEKTDGSDAGGSAKTRKTLSQRLMSALTGEVRALERAIRSKGSPEAPPGAEAAAMAAGAKVRVDAIGNLTKTLEKLLELTRLESLAARGRSDEEGEAERLSAELMKRLRAIDRRRGDGRRLFPDAVPQGGAA